MLQGRGLWRCQIQANDNKRPSENPHFVVQEDGMSENLQMMIANQIEVLWEMENLGWFKYSNTFCEDNAGNSNFAWKCATSFIAHKAPCNWTKLEATSMSHVGQGQLIGSQQVYHLGPSIDGSHQVAEMHRWSKWQHELKVSSFESSFLFYDVATCTLNLYTFHISIPFETLCFLGSVTKSLVVAPIRL